MSSIKKILIITLLVLQMATCLLAYTSHLENIIRNERTSVAYRPRILCWVLSFDTQVHNEKTQTIAETWAPRCDKFLIVKNGTHFEEKGNTLLLPIKHESRGQLWHKVVQVFLHLHKKYLNQFDWFMKADDDTYVIVDSLRKFLSKHRPQELIYFGHKFRPFVSQGYMSGGSGYVLSREALSRLVKLGFNKNLAECHLKKGMVEDVHMGQCLEAVQVEAGDSRDERKRETFLPLAPQIYFEPNMSKRIKWFPSYSYYYSQDHQASSNSLSDQPISFHYLRPQQMRFIDYLLYHVAPNQITANKNFV